jgi:hypothetical protein
MSKGLDMSTYIIYLHDRPLRPVDLSNHIAETEFGEYRAARADFISGCPEVASLLFDETSVNALSEETHRNHGVLASTNLAAIVHRLSNVAKYCNKVSLVHAVTSIEMLMQLIRDLNWEQASLVVDYGDTDIDDEAIASYLKVLCDASKTHSLGMSCCTEGAFFRNQIYVDALASHVKMCAFYALIRAAALGDISRASTILAKFPNLIRGFVGYRDYPLHTAVRHGRPELVDLFIQAGADINEYQDLEGTPFYIAVVSGHDRIAMQLIERGINVNSQNNPYSETPLMISAYNGKLDICKSLITNGADVNVVTNDGRSALAYAQQHGNADLVEMLLSAGARH